MLRMETLVYILVWAICISQHSQGYEERVWSWPHPFLFWEVRSSLDSILDFACSAYFTDVYINKYLEH